MLKLFYDYCNRGMIKHALLVGHNMVNQNVNDVKSFEAYFQYLIYLIKNQELDKAKMYLQQAMGTLAFFSENAILDSETVEFILAKERELDEINSFLAKKEQELKREAIRQEVTFNNDALEILEQLLVKIQKCENENEFSLYLNDLGRVDQTINRERLSSSQEIKYAELTKKSSELVSNRMAYFDKIKNRDYNIQAVEAYERVFNMFKNGKVLDGHKDIIKSLFIYDPSRLYNETLVYYNHVYGYILGKLSDEDKFTLTKYAIMCEKKR